MIITYKNNCEIVRIQDSYEDIRRSYASKKQEPWWELLDIYPPLKESRSGILIDVGGGNGRNLKKCERTLTVSLDITRALLEDYVADENHQRIEGSLPYLPFRKCSSEEVISIAVIHHLRTHEGRASAIFELQRVTEGKLLFTVWRKWRPSNARKILKLIRDGEDPLPFIDHERPWKDSTGEILTYRFYHYFCRKELIDILQDVDYSIQKMGGKSSVDNYFVEIRSNCRNHSLLN